MIRYTLVTLIVGGIHLYYFLAYVFTVGDPQSEWLKRDESNTEKSGLGQNSYL